MTDMTASSAASFREGKATVLPANETLGIPRRYSALSADADQTLQRISVIIPIFFCFNYQNCNLREISI